MMTGEKKIGKIKKTEIIVERIMRARPETRDDDFLLVLAVYDTFVNTHFATVDYLFTHHKEYGIPSMETITRARRRIQEHKPELRSSQKTQDKRYKQECDIVDYTRGWED